MPQIKTIYDMPTSNITLSGEKLKIVPLRSGARQEGQFSSLLFNIVLEVLATEIEKKKKYNDLKLERKK